MFVGAIVKEISDHSRVTVDYSKWLDPGESIQAVISNTIALGTSGWGLQPYSSQNPPPPPPPDPTPLVFQSVELVNNATAVLMMLDDGTQGNAYTVTLVVHASPSLRELTVEVAVNILGVPPQPPQTQAPPALPPYAALPITGGTMLGPLYLFEDPQTTMEAVTRRYVDAWVTVFDGQVQAETARAEAAEASLAAGLVSEANARTNAIAVEASTRAAADSAEASTRASADAAEAATRAAADATETARAEAAEAAEASARAAADSAETAARVASDGGLSTAINNETLARLADVSALNASIASLESSGGGTATGLQSQITAEVSRATAAESAIANTILLQSARAGATTSNTVGGFLVTFAPAFEQKCVWFTITTDDHVAGINIVSLSATSASGIMLDSSNNPVPNYLTTYGAIGF